MARRYLVGQSVSIAVDPSRLKVPPPRRAIARRLLPRPFRNFVRRPGATTRWLAQECEYLFGYAPQVHVREDWTVQCHPGSRGTFEGVSAGDDYRAELDGFVRRCSHAMRLLDVGSHFGLFTLAALKFGGAAARVVAVDPSAYPNRVLRANLNLMNALERVRIVEAAVGARIGELPMLTAGAGGMHFLIASNSDRPDAKSAKMTTVTELVREAGYPFTHLKIDVEGHEEHVLAGGIDFIREFKPLIFLELHGQILRNSGRDPRVVMNLLGDCGYRKYEWRGHLIDPREAAEMDIARIVCVPG
jgi:FkbM family methyltransferase